MNRRTQMCVFGAILGLASFLPGCDQGNEKASKIEGAPAVGTMSDEERMQLQKGGNSAPAGYPGSTAPAPAKKK